MVSTAGPASNLLATLYDNVSEPVYLIDDQCGVLFRNPAAHLLDARARPHFGPGKSRSGSHACDTGLTPLMRDCTRRFHADRQVRHMANGDWLICISPLPINLAVLHPVFVVQLISRQQLQHIPCHALSDLFGLTPLEWTIINGLARNDSLRQIALHTHRSRYATCASLKQILSKCGVNSPNALLALLHQLTRLRH